MADTPGPAARSVAGQLSTQSRKARRNLLLLSGVAFAVTRLGLLPTKISALGIEFDKTNQATLVWLVGALTLYFLVEFCLYSASDVVIASEQQFNRELSAYSKNPHGGESSADGLLSLNFPKHKFVLIYRYLGALRSLFELVLPIALGVYALYLVAAARGGA